MKNSALTFFVLNLALVSTPMFQAGAALSDSELAIKEAKLTASAASDETAVLKEKILLQQSALQELSVSLANANNEAEGFKREASDLRMKIETLGITDKSGNKLEEKLLSAVRDLRLAQRSEKDMREQLVKLSETIIALLKTSENLDPQLRLGLEAELRSTNEMLGAASAQAVAAKAAPASLTEGMVINVKDDLALVVANIGRRQNVKIGMPFQVIRNDQPIGEVRVVDVRDRICGAIVCNMLSEKQKIEVGDRLKIAARQ